MTALIRLLAALAVLALLALAALWLGPRAVEWDSWRERLAIIAADRLGRPVSLNGPVELVLLPQPMLRAGGVAVGGPEDALRVTARLLRLRLDLPALLRGRFEPRELALVGADLTLPWPPGPLLAFRPPAWITEFDAQVEDGRIRIGGTVLEGVTARLTSGGALHALEIRGNVAFAGRPGRFQIALGRPGWDGISLLQSAFDFAAMSGGLRGVLVPGTGFEGTVELRGPDLAALLPAPSGAFRATGRLTATADLIAGQDLMMDIAGAPARGGATLRLLPTPRLDVALRATRLELDRWIGTLRGGDPTPWPVALDVEAETAVFGGQTLRRLRGAVALEERRLTLDEIAVELPGGTALQFAGATVNGRLELDARFSGPDLRPTLLALGLPIEEIDPTLLRRGEGRLRLVLEETQASVPELAASFDGLRLSGAGVLRHGPRPSLGLGLNLDRLEVERWAPGGLDLAALGRGVAGFDLNLRLAAEQATWAGLRLERAALDAALEAGRLTLRRFSGRLAETDVVASGVATLAPALRFADLSLEASGPHARALAALLPGGWPDGTVLAGQPVALRVSGGGPPEALALRGGAELGELRLEASGTLDTPGRRGTASITLRHPGASRLLAEGFGSDAGGWLGEGSFSLIASLAMAPGTVSAESFELVAGGLRGRGALAWAGGPRPRVAGRLSAERLPVPAFPWRGIEPLGFGVLAGFDAELALEAARIESGDTAVENAAATLRLEDGRLRLEGARARVAGGAAEGSFALELTPDGLPRLALEGRLSEATLAAPLLGAPFDLTAGRGEAAVNVTAAGHSPAAMLDTLEGSWRLALRDGVVTGFDLAAASTAWGESDAAVAEAALRRALIGGATAFDRLDLDGTFHGGVARVETGRLITESGVSATILGEVVPARGAFDLRIGLRPEAPEAPEIGLRVSGPVERPEAQLETAEWARWRAGRR